MSNLKKRLRDIETKRDAALLTMGDEVRKKLVLPACRKHGLLFSSCNGEYWFTRRNYPERFPHDMAGTFRDVEEAKALGFSMKRVFAALDLETSSHDTLGTSYVRAVTEEDLLDTR